jgi:hypothetical protein
MVRPAALALLFFADFAGDAQEPRDEMAPSPRTTIVDAAPRTRPAKRPVPSYSGREEETSLRSWLWGPRIVLFPFYLAAEYLVRRPVGALMMAAEHEPLLKRIGGGKHRGAIPTFLFDAGFLPNIGIYAWWDGAFAPTNALRLHASTWGPESSQAAFVDRLRLGTDEHVSFRGSVSHRSDLVFFGLGPDSIQALRSRYEATIVDAAADYDRTIAKTLGVTTRAGLRDVTFGGGSCCGTPSVEERIQSGQLERPPRYDHGYAALVERGGVTFETGPAKVGVAAEPGFDVSRKPGASWIKYEARAGAQWEVKAPGRVLSVHVATLFTEPLAGGAGVIPFTELATLGGFTSMRGFVAGRLVDRSAAVATVEYAWPIWPFLEGTLDAAVGNVFGQRLEGLAPKKLRLSTTFGVRSRTSRDLHFDILGGIGTETFDHGADVTSVRVALGAHHAF